MKRRTFLETVGTAVPSMQLLRAAEPAGKFTTIDLSRYFNTSASDFGPREQARSMSRDGLIHVPSGEQTFLGIPFALGPDDTRAKSWLVVTSSGSGVCEIPLDRKARHVCLAQFCDWDVNESLPADIDAYEKVGQKLADAVLVYEDGTEHALPIRRRFEVNAPSTAWGHLTFTALPHSPQSSSKLTDPLTSGAGWGFLQQGVHSKQRGGPFLWICALENPQPERKLKALRLRASGPDVLALCGLTLFDGRDNPLRRERLSLYRITLPEAADKARSRWTVDVDLGVVARVYSLAPFHSEAWLKAEGAGLGEREMGAGLTACLYAEVTANPDATLWLRDGETGSAYAFDLNRAEAGEEIAARIGNSRIQVLEREKVWLHGRIVDAATGRPTPVRIAFRSRDGRYIPPYGHRTEIDAEWFQDYGADLKLQESSFAYVDGTFQVELPVGEVYVEIAKGFEYVAVRRKLTIDPAQRELRLEIARHTNLRTRGWVTADTHVHFLSPSTAVLEAQAEGLNLVNLLAAQWGDLFTNVGDLPHGPLTSQDKETIVWVGTENRQHLLGHLGLLGGHGGPVFPMSAGGPGESYLGDPLWTSLGDWADACRQREGVVIAVHFPNPTAELAADIVLGKIDGVELYPRTGNDQFRSLGFLDWYRYLNCGYRVAAVGGTDKMLAATPVGASRTYAHIGAGDFTFETWAAAVRAGRTFMSTGPLLLLQVDGRVPGDEIVLGKEGGTVQVKAETTSHVPFHRLEIVFNGRVVASRDASGGTRDMTFQESIKIPGPGWLAARCSSSLGPATAWPFGIAAHTSPVYFLMPGPDLFSPPTATYLLTLIEGSQAWAEKIAIRPDPDRFAKVLRLFEEARAHLHRRLHEHGVKHT